ncbi:hypothetical protein SAZ10_31740 [Mesorhizobium sp. BAC0120]|uniref:tetratricopeptide repeat protein n=1 Tax=Mesorhizobium sp. BAC0120 TaxID=3090670 RepID=UPI00298D3A74|nr:hypothetical protein [Mesorhizobium sp. BAC0120]MDW6026342.1 hypothetical protein [Mesorhizobium sp. BAC0120]
MLLVGAVATTAIFAGAPAPAPASDVKSEVSKARDFFLSGIYQLALRTPHSLERAKQDFRQAVRLDPKSDEALAWLAKTYAVIGEAAQPAQAADAFTLARYWADRALSANPRNAEAIAASAIVALYGSRNVALAGQLLEQALAISPNSAAANHWYAVARMYQGDFDIALGHIQKAQNLSPRSPAIRATKGRILALLGRSQDAKRELTDLIESAPEFAAPYRYMAGLDLVEGRSAQFLKNMEAVARIRKDTPLSAMISAAQSGVQEGGAGVTATKIPELFAGQAGQPGNHAYLQARIAALQGDPEAAIAYLEQALALREQAVLAINIDPIFREMRNSDRFITIVRRLGLSPGEPVLANTDPVASNTN